VCVLIHSFFVGMKRLRPDTASDDDGGVSRPAPSKRARPESVAAATILDALPSDMLFEIATTYRIGRVDFDMHRLQSAAFGHGVGRLMAMTCKTMQQAVTHCIQPLNGHPLGRFVALWYAWFVTVGDRPLLREHLLFKSNVRGIATPVGLCPDAARNWLASPAQLVDTEWAVPLMISAVVYARRWDRLPLLLYSPYSLAAREGYTIVMASHLVDIPAGRPDTEHIAREKRLAYTQEKASPHLMSMLAAAFREIATTPRRGRGTVSARCPPWVHVHAGRQVISVPFRAGDLGQPGILACDMDGTGASALPGRGVASGQDRPWRSAMGDTRFICRRRTRLRVVPRERVPTGRPSAA
jgi:hypothetical protein